MNERDYMQEEPSMRPESKLRFLKHPLSITEGLLRMIFRFSHAPSRAQKALTDLHITKATEELVPQTLFLFEPYKELYSCEISDTALPLIGTEPNQIDIDLRSPLELSLYKVRAEEFSHN